MKKTILSLMALAGMASSFFAVAATPEQIDEKVSHLLKHMTLEEKVGQLNQLSGRGLAPDMVQMVKEGKVGSILNEVDPATVNALQREAVENSRLGIPLIIARDVIHGFKTIFPVPLGQAASWNEELVRQGARIAASEASSVGVRWTFSPMVDIARDSRWGRIAEGFGEDPVLASRLGVAMVEGYQGNDLSNPSSIAACVKHFAGYGAAESGKDYNTTWIPDVLLRDVYLPPFKACADAGAATFMCSFNDINGVHSSGNRRLLKDILRDEWGWKGLIVSDWGSIEQMRNHGFSKDLRQAALQGAKATVDVDMENYAYCQHLADLVNSGEVIMEELDAMVANILRLKFELGLFDNPYVDESAVAFYAPESLEAARRAVEESAVLLKNNGVLPVDFSKVKRVAVVGPMADAQHDQAGTWVFDLEKEHCVTPLTSLKEKCGDKVVYAKGMAHTRDRSHDGFKDALSAAKGADVVLYFAGEEAVLSGEAHSRADISLPGAQKELLRELKKAGKPVVMIVQAGRPLTIADDADLCDAVLYIFHGGTMAGPGIVNLLSGHVNPSGKLPVSFPKMVGQLPLYYNHKNTGRPAEGITYIDDIELEAGQTSTGCTSFYLDAGDGPAYPFGYGQSYTTFSYGTPTLSSTEIPAHGMVSVTCDVTNTGKVAGSEVVQLYVRDLVGSLARPVKELKDFQKVTLQPGETKTVFFTLPASSLSFTGADLQPVVEEGDFNLWVAGDSASGTPVSFAIKN